MSNEEAPLSSTSCCHMRHLAAAAPGGSGGSGGSVPSTLWRQPLTSVGVQDSKETLR
jgi:hypothetical protein